jgi:transcription initiation factor TFIID subunit 1
MDRRDQPEQKVNDPLAPRNDILDSGTWLQDVIWDARRVSPSLLEDEDETVQLVTDKVPEASAKLSSSKAIAKLDPYNFSNDHIYEQSKESRHRIRQTFGAIEVFHSGPAKALQLPFVSEALRRCDGCWLTVVAVQDGFVETRSEIVA